MTTTHRVALLIHGGAGVMPGHDYSVAAEFMHDILPNAGQRLRAGDSALDLVTDMVAAMEASGLFVAGKGSCVNQNNQVELDASIMTGHDMQAGAICAARDVLHPVQLARAVMEHSPHAFLAGQGAEAFADLRGLERVSDPAGYYRSATELTGGESADEAHGSLSHGTVGAVALDITGNLAAATSTGGTLNKPPGRVGDTPVIGAGTWADQRVAVSCTGQGEYFLRQATAHDLAARMAYQGVDVDTAAKAVIAAIGSIGGDGGLIAVDNSGRISMPFNSGGMKRGYVGPEGDPVVEIY